MPHPLYTMLKPCERIHWRRTFNGPNDYVDIYALGMARIGADVRDVTEDGVEIFSYRSVEVVPFEAIERVVLRTATLYKEICRMTWERDALEKAA